MGLVIGVIFAILGIGLLVVPIILSFDTSEKLKTQDTAENIKKYQKNLRTAAIFTIIAGIISLVALILVWIYAEKKGEALELAKEQTATSSITSATETLSTANQLAGTVFGVQGKSSFSSLPTGNLEALYQRYKSTGSLRKAAQVAEEAAEEGVKLV